MRCCWPPRHPGQPSSLVGSCPGRARCVLATSRERLASGARVHTLAGGARARCGSAGPRRYSQRRAQRPLGHAAGRGVPVPQPGRRASRELAASIPTNAAIRDLGPAIDRQRRCGQRRLLRHHSRAWLSVLAAGRRGEWPTTTGEGRYGASAPGARQTSCHASSRAS